MTIHFSTTEFEFSHGRKPRGYGYWGFFFGVTKNVWFAPNVSRLRRREEGRARGSQAPQLRRGLHRPLIDREPKRGLL